MGKYILAAFFVIGLAYTGTIMVERIMFFRGHPIFAPKDVAINQNDKEVIAKLGADCKAERGQNTVLEIAQIQFDEDNATYARCGMWWPNADTYRLVAK